MYGVGKGGRRCEKVGEGGRGVVEGGIGVGEEWEKVGKGERR